MALDSGECLVRVVKDGQARACRLLWEEAGYREFALSLDSPQGLLEVRSSDLFAGLAQLRLLLEPDGWVVAVQGSRGNAWASGMQRDMNGARKVYIYEPGRDFSREDAVGIFEDADPAEAVTVQKQRENYKAWQAGLRGTRPRNPPRPSGCPAEREPGP